MDWTTIKHHYPPGTRLADLRPISSLTNAEIIQWARIVEGPDYLFEVVRLASPQSTVMLVAMVEVTSPETAQTWRLFLTPDQLTPQAFHYLCELRINLFVE